MQVNHLMNALLDADSTLNARQLASIAKVVCGSGMSAKTAAGYIHGWKGEKRAEQKTQAERDESHTVYPRKD
jgi:hypothetical protein